MYSPVGGLTVLRSTEPCVGSPPPFSPQANRLLDEHRSVTTLGLLLTAFFWCSGGIYGNDGLIEAAPTG
jgi:hypothetical protein